MHDEKDRRAIAEAAEGRTEIEFELDDEQQKALAECLERSGRLTVRFKNVGVTRVGTDEVSGIVVID